MGVLSDGLVPLFSMDVPSNLKLAKITLVLNPQRNSLLKAT